MGFSIVNSKGQKYFLNSVVGKNGKTVYYFGKAEKNPVDLPEGYIVIESPLTKLPILKKK
jgi:hypothetical protein